MNPSQKTVFGFAGATALFLALSANRTAADISNNPAASTQPTSANDDEQDGAIPEEYSILRTRNAFDAGGENGGKGAADGPEASLVFKGVIDSGGKFTAFFENLGNKQVTEAVVGQSLASGIVKSIDLDALEYDAGGSVRRIEVGHTLTGELPPPPPPPPPPASQPATPPDAGNMPPGGPGNPSGPFPPQPPGRQRHG
jgi:hypothetical protein